MLRKGLGSAGARNTRLSDAMPSLTPVPGRTSNSNRAVSLAGFSSPDRMVKDVAVWVPITSAAQGSKSRVSVAPAASVTVWVSV